MRTETLPQQTRQVEHSGSPACSAFLSRAKGAGYTDEDAHKFYNDVVSEQAANNVVNFLMRRPDCFKDGVVKTMNDAVAPYEQTITGYANKSEDLQDLSANAEQVCQT